MYENDLAGNRLWTNQQSSTLGVKMEWDPPNRMTYCVRETGGAQYTYRADGMRTSKIEGVNLDWTELEEEEQQEEGSGYWDTIYSVNRPTTRYFYDGQMGIEEDFAREIEESMEVDVIRYGLGARGVDMIETDAYDSSPSAAYPLYDGHGNMVATLAKSGSNSFTVTARRYTDPWGVTRVGAATGKPDQRYCANLGHRQDDESGLTYMRARYYEAGTGRFVSEDPTSSDFNFFSYASNCPTLMTDRGGTWSEETSALFAIGQSWVFLAFCLAAAAKGALGTRPDLKAHRLVLAAAAMAVAVSFHAIALGSAGGSVENVYNYIMAAPALAGMILCFTAGMAEFATANSVLATATIVAIASYMCAIMGELVNIDMGP